MSPLCFYHSRGLLGLHLAVRSERPCFTLQYDTSFLTVRTHVILSPCDKVLSPLLSLPLLSALSPNSIPPPTPCLPSYMLAECLFCVSRDLGNDAVSRVCDDETALVRGLARL